MWDVRWSRGRILRHNAGFISCSDSKDHSNHFASDNIRSKAIYTLSGLLKHNATAIAQFEAVGGWDTLRDAFSGTVSILPVSSISPLMHDAFFARSALRLRHRRPAQSCVSPQQPPHVLCPHLRSDDNIRRRPSTLWPPTSGGTRAPRFARIDAGRSDVGRHGD